MLHITHYPHHSKLFKVTLGYLRLLNVTMCYLRLFFKNLVKIT
ncbi:protein of unknown function [Maridesulfovibrio hydrothermalis AM13 = DSM 14728]|uniref:Uncharacterized protein n=1 Tax=Maridesulfovibrio hydrothermalis AM13 = DSM 14728 TaxID=1121451 RepID=L0RCY3_9BACT|nr:protein of unknown function [Maridesulfovibrio hydrothermalis AM13 = DSM 14728]